MTRTPIPIAPRGSDHQRRINASLPQVQHNLSTERKENMEEKKNSHPAQQHEKKEETLHQNNTKPIMLSTQRRRRTNDASMREHQQ
jgi:hypothetical protein